MNMRIPSQITSVPSDPAARTPRLQRGKARVAALLASGAAVFAEKGIEAATMTEIAARAGASIGSLYQFFPTKDLLAASLHAEQLALLSDMLAGLRDEAPRQRPAALADALFAGLLTFLQINPAFVALAERRLVDPARKAESRAHLRDQIAGLFGQATPALPRERAEVVAVIVLQLMKAAMALSASDAPPLRDRVIAELRQMLRHHLDTTGPG